MVEIVKQLNLNRHPRDCNNYSLVCAGNIKLTHDKHSITNEEGIINNSVIAEAIDDENIVGIIPITNELVIFTDGNKIYRYNEKTNTCVLANTKWVWSGGKIKGTYATNVHNHLIIAIAEYDKHELCPIPTPVYNGDVPLKIINLDEENDIFPTNALSYAVSPIVPYAYCTEFKFVDGYTYKGYYEFYIRYKISNNNYTQWFLINGKPLVDVTEFKDITTFVHPDLLTPSILNQGGDSYKYVTNGHADFVSDDYDFCKVALQATLDFTKPSDAPNYSEYQLAYVVSSKTYNKCYKTNDIPITTKTYIVNPKAEIEYSADELVIDYCNYYNVRQITNYQNRVYIADYKEHSANPKDIEDVIDNITISGETFDATLGGHNSTDNDTKTWVDNFYFNYNGDESVGKLAKNYVPNTAYKLEEVVNNGVRYMLLPLKYLVGDNGNGEATIAHVCIAAISGSTETIEISGSQDYIAIVKPTIPETAANVNINHDNNRLAKYDGVTLTLYQNVTYFEIHPHLVKNNTDTLNRFYTNAFDGHIVREINTDGDNTSAGAVGDILNNFLLPNEVYDFYLNFVDKFGHISTGIKIDPTNFDSNYYFTYTNNNNDDFVRVKQPGYLDGIRPTISGLNLPNNYIAAFLSYRKFEKSNKLHGLLYDGSKFTNGIINYDDRVDIGINRKKDFYDNNITFNNILFNYYKNNKKPSEWGSVRNKYKYLAVGAKENDNTIINAAVVPGLKVANDAVADNVGKESYLWMASSATENNSHEPKLVVYASEDANNYINKGKLYSGKNNIIIPTSLIITNGSTYDNYTGYNGFLAFDSAIIYSKKGYVLNVTDGRIRNLTGDKIISNKAGTDDNPIDSTDPYMCYIFAYLWDYPLHIRRFKNRPRVSTIVPGEDVSDTVKVEHIIQTVVEPKDSIDLFEYPHLNKSDVGSYKTIIGYDESMLDVTVYQKTIRRSNVLGDETEEIGWRRFPVEGYKNIIENKGIITNILGLGHYFFAHTEHSLFMFDIDASIHTEEQDIKMYQPDVFEVAYQEVFTSDKGYGGLQDDLAWCVGEFGYVFYNNDFHRFYRFDNDKLNYIDGSIINYLLKEQPVNVRFGVDKFNARLLIRFDADSAKTLSYDYELNTFVSWHNYDFVQGFNTKVNIYYLWNNYKHIAGYDINNYGQYVNGSNNSYIPYGGANNSYNCGIDIIVNTEFDVLKMLEYITYDCRKELEDWDDGDQDRHLRYHPYSGNNLRIYNEDCDSGVMNITINANTFNRFVNYKKPWYELSHWNFNYFRDNINSHPGTNISDKLRRLFGKYIIFSFRFDNDNKKIEFENLDCKFSLNR